MDFNRFLQTMAIITILSLVYINMQMRIIDLAYSGKKKEKAVRELQEENGQLTYQILALKSSNNLGSKLFDEKINMRFLGTNDIVRIKTSEDTSMEHAARIEDMAANKSHPIFNLLSLVTTREAKAK